MADGRACGRPLYPSRPGSDLYPACVMHSVDPEKDRAAFHTELLKIQNDVSLCEDPSKRLDFTGFFFQTFPQLTVDSPVCFAGAAVLGAVRLPGTDRRNAWDFAGALFSGDVQFYHSFDHTEALSFRSTTFLGNFSLYSVMTPKVDFSAAVFEKDATFSCCVFRSGADFSQVTFKKDLSINATTFEGPAAKFDGISVMGRADLAAVFVTGPSFVGATFAQALNLSCFMAHVGQKDFTRAVFLAEVELGTDCIFEQALFSKRLSCRSLIFSRARFAGATFNEGADFRDATFDGLADFASATFDGDTSFSQATFSQGVSLGRSRIRAELDFSRSVVGPPAKPEPSQAHAAAAKPVIDLSEARIEGRGRAYLTQMNFAAPRPCRFRLLDCELHGIRFDDVNWYREKGRIVVQDELDLREGAASPAAQRRPTHGLVAMVYGRLVTNFDSARDYDHAEECFCSTMEVKRRDHAEKVASRVGIRLYGLASKYGSSYVRASVVCLFILVAFGFLYCMPSVGLRSTATREVILLPSHSTALPLPADSRQSWIRYCGLL